MEQEEARRRAASQYGVFKIPQPPKRRAATEAVPSGRAPPAGVPPGATPSSKRRRTAEGGPRIPSGIIGRASTRAQASALGVSPRQLQPRAPVRTPPPIRPAPPSPQRQAPSPRAPQPGAQIRVSPGPPAASAFATRPPLLPRQPQQPQPYRPPEPRPQLYSAVKGTPEWAVAVHRDADASTVDNFLAEARTGGVVDVYGLLQLFRVPGSDDWIVVVSSRPYDEAYPIDTTLTTEDVRSIVTHALYVRGPSTAGAVSLLTYVRQDRGGREGEGVGFEEPSHTEVWLEIDDGDLWPWRFAEEVLESTEPLDVDDCVTTVSLISEARASLLDLANARGAIPDKVVRAEMVAAALDGFSKALARFCLTASPRRTG